MAVLVMERAQSMAILAKGRRRRTMSHFRWGSK